MTYRKILVPVDFSPCSLQAFRAAAELAAEFHAVIVVLHVVDEKIIDQVASIGNVKKEQIAKLFHRKAREQFRAFLEKEEPATSVKRKVTVGAPFEEILKAIRSEGFDLVVMGRYGGTGELEKILFGSTAEKVVRLSPRSVLSVVL